LDVEEAAMQGSRFRPGRDVVDETMKLARGLRRRPVFETQPLIAAALAGFALALLLGPRPRGD
jgi:hypothetical protein